MYSKFNQNLFIQNYLCILSKYYLQKTKIKFLKMIESKIYKIYKKIIIISK